MTVRTIDEIFRDFVTDGVPASGPFNPHKPDIRDTLKALTEGSGNFPDNRVIRLNNANEGTANNIVVTASVAIPATAYQVLYILNVTQENTGPVTVSGAINRALVTNASAPIPAGYLTPGMAALCIDTGSELRMLSYGDVEAEVESLVSRAEDAAAAAEAAAGNNWSSFDTRSSIEAANVPSPVNYGRTAGYGAVGDGGDALYTRVESEPSHAGWVRSANGDIFAITKRTVRASQFGALPGVSDLHLRIGDAVNYLNAIGGGELQIDYNDEYVLSDRILPNILTSDILITNPALGILKAGVGQAVPILDLRASNTSGAVTSRILRLHDMRYDCSQGSTPSEGQYCTALNTQYFQQVLDDGTYAYGGAFGNSNSDSGHTPTANIYTKITNGRFIGFGDNGVYATGDNTPGSGGDGYSCEIVNCDFFECKNAGQGKRELTLLSVTGGTVYRCTSGFGSSEVYPTGPARNMELEGVFFDQVTASIAQFRGPTKGGMWDCTIRDWGRTIDTNESVGTNAIAIVIRGASRLNFSDNHFTRVNWALDDQRAVSFDNLTMFPGQAEEITYTQGEHHFEGNHYGGIARVYVEAAGGNPSTFLEETTRSIPAGQIWNSTFNGNHVLTYMKVGSGRRYTFQSGLEYVRPNLPDLVKNYSVNTTLIADDSGCLVTNQGQAAKRTFTLPTAVAGLSYKFMNMDGAGMRVQAGSGDNIRINGSQSTALGYADSSTSIGVSIELVAVDATNWVAKSYTGTWTLG